MKDEMIFEEIKKIVFNVAGARHITMDTDLVKDLSLNSFDVVNMLAAVEQAFGIEISIQDVWELNQVKDIMVYLKRRLGE